MTLDANQKPDTSNSSSDKDKAVSIKDQLIDMIRNDPNLPSFGSSISSIVQISSSADGSTAQLTNLILSDVSLSQKILSLSNSLAFRPPSAQAVTNITKAIQILGLDTVKSCALAMMLVDGMPKKDAENVRHELSVSLSASLVGRSLAKRSSFPNAEEVAIAALFKNMGCLLVAIYDDKLYKRTMALVDEGKHSKAQASLQTMGCSFDELTEIAMREWLIPDSIIEAMDFLSVNTLKAPKNRQEWMRQVVEFSETAALIVLQEEDDIDDSASEILLNRFGTVLNLDQAQLDELVTSVTVEVCELSNNTQLKQQLLDKKVHANSDNKSVIEANNIKENLLDSSPIDSQGADTHPSGKPYASLRLLTTGIKHLIKMVASKKYKINELILQILKTLHSGLGFNFITICLKDIKTNQYQARSSFGKNNIAIQQKFIFTSASSNDLFSLTIKKNVDVAISDSSDPKMRAMLPHWHLELRPRAKSFIILPLVIKGQPIGLIYADRQPEALEGISSDEMKLIKTLKDMAIATLSNRT